MAAQYKNIFKPIQLKNGVILKNRLIFSNGQQSFVCGPEDGPNEAIIVDAANFARAGGSIVHFGHFGSMGGGANPHPMPYIDKEAIRAGGGRVVEPDPLECGGTGASYNYDDPRTFNLLGQTAEAVHLYDAKIIVKLGASFPPGISLNGMEEPEELMIFRIPKEEERTRKTPILGGDPFLEEKPVPTLDELRSRAATKEQINEAIEDIVDMCVRYQNAGFDGMSLRGDRWGLNASSNVREDEYNGEIENRGRFQLELYTRIKEVCGPEFIVDVVMPGESPHGHDGQLPHGYTEEEFVRFMMMVQDVVDLVEIREATGMGYQCLAYNSKLHVHKTLEYAKHLRKAGFQKTIVVNGGYNDPDEMEQILGEGIIDMIATARTFRAEPDFIEKLRSDGKEVPTPCLRCNKCHGTYEHACGCSVNPTDALHHRLPLIVEEPRRSKKVAVIGGGLIGMRASCFAAERGHQVTLFEKSDRLGGKAAYYSKLYPQKWEIARYLDWTIGEMDRRGVSDVRLNCAPDPKDLEAEGFEAVIACTGSREKYPLIKGCDTPGVWKDEDIYMGNVDPGQRVVIVGGGDVPTETAMYLASTGREVTVLTRQERLMRKQAYAHGPLFTTLIYLPELGYGGFAPCYYKYDNLKPIYFANTVKVAPDSVTYVKDGEEITLEADTVIVSGGYAPCAEEALQYADCTDEFYLAGDVRTDCHNLMLGNRSAYGRAIML